MLQKDEGFLDVSLECMKEPLMWFQAKLHNIAHS